MLFEPYAYIYFRNLGDNIRNVKINESSVVSVGHGPTHREQTSDHPFEVSACVTRSSETNSPTTRLVVICAVC